jgi:hypothetical protein
MGMKKASERMMEEGRRWWAGEGKVNDVDDPTPTRLQCRPLPLSTDPTAFSAHPTNEEQAEQRKDSEKRVDLHASTDESRAGAECDDHHDKSGEEDTREWDTSRKKSSGTHRVKQRDDEGDDHSSWQSVTVDSCGAWMGTVWRKGRTMLTMSSLSH